MDNAVALVTGGAGFIGSHMVDCLLGKGHRVRVIDNLVSGHERNLAHLSNEPRLSCEWRDITALQPDDSLFKGVTWVFHFAGLGDIVPSIAKPVPYIETNVMGTLKVCEAAKAAAIQKCVYAASSSCYGLAETPTDEQHPIAPEHPYALSKYLGEQLALHWHKVYGLPVNSIRIFNAYGPRVRTTGAYGAVFGVFLKQKWAQKPFTVVGDGSQKRDFIYVTDVAEAFYRAATTPLVGEIFNLGAGHPQSIRYLVSLLGGEVEYVPKRPGEPDCTFANIQKIRDQLGFNPRVSFETGVQQLLNDLDAWSDAPLWDKHSIEQATQAWFSTLGKPTSG